MVIREDTPEKLKEVFDDRAVELIAKLARKYALNEKAELKEIVDNMSNDELEKLPESLRRRSGWEGYVAEVMFDAMVDCVRHGVYKQESWAYSHYSQMLQSCIGKGS